MKKYLLFLAIGLFSTCALGQFKSTGSIPGIRHRFIEPASGGLLNGLLDPNRMNMSQSYSMTYIASGGNGFMQGLYLNNIRYRLSNPIMLDLQLGYLHTPYNSYNGGFNGELNGEFVGGATLTYKPTNNVSFSLGFSRAPLYCSPYSYNPYGYYPGYWFNENLILSDPANFRPKEYSPGIDGK